MPLKDTEVVEGESVDLTCEVNVPNLPSHWFKDDMEIFSTSQRELLVDGVLHILMIPKSTLQDESDYTVVIKGKVSKALLLVEGISCFLFHFGIYFICLFFYILKL